MIDVLHALPRATEFGGVQRFALDVSSHLSSSVNSRVLDLGIARRQQARGLLRLAATAKAKPNAVLHHWNILSAAAPGIRSDVVCCYGNDLLTIAKPLGRRALKRSQRIVCCSNFTRDLAVDRFNLETSDLDVILPGITLRPTNRPLWVPGQRPVRIGTLARFVPRKNLARILEALAVLNDQGDMPFEFHLAGDGPDRADVLGQLQAQSFPSRYWGTIEDHVKHGSFFPGIDIFVLPTLHLQNDVEGFGIVYLEANSHGVPVVASRSGGVVDAVASGRSGEFVDATSPQSIADGITRVYRALPTMIASSSDWANRFSVQSTAASFEEIYRDTAEHRDSRHITKR